MPNIQQEKIVPIKKHAYLFLDTAVFICPYCNGSEHVKHCLLLANNKVREECDNCFIKDKSVRESGILANPETFILKKSKQDATSSVFELQLFIS